MGMHVAVTLCVLVETKQGGLRYQKVDLVIPRTQKPFHQLEYIFGIVECFLKMRAQTVP